MLHYNSDSIDLTFTSVPEPAAGTLLMLGATALLSRRRRRR
jgi:hypothetical protein